MTGTIRAMGSPTAPGAIVGSDGSTIRFESAEVAPCELVCLSVGRAVTFDLDGGRHLKAINIRAEALKHEVTGKGPRAEDVRLVGFEQRGDTRAYYFEWLPAGDSKRSCQVTGSLRLFTRYGVGFQEGPKLCLRLLMQHADALCASGTGLLRWSLTDADMLSHLARRAAQEKPGPRPNRL